MITAPDFAKKQILFIFFNEGEKIAFSNDNIVVKNSDGKIKFQCTCYRLFVVYAIGHCSITSVLLQKAKKFGFFIALMSASFRLVTLVGAEKDSNTLLKRKQYQYDGLDIAKRIINNKMSNQLVTLKKVRSKTDDVKNAIDTINGYLPKLEKVNNIHEIMAYEGLASKVYFANHFDNVYWKGRKPRIKSDIINSVLDIGYTLLFTFVDTILQSYGFDTYCGVLHTQFYMRKSLVCDIVEPFRPLIDKQIKNAFNLKQIQKEDFVLINSQYRLKYQKSAEYIQFLMKPILENKDSIFLYIQSYYRSFMKGVDISQYPYYLM